MLFLRSHTPAGPSRHATESSKNPSSHNFPLSFFFCNRSSLRFSVVDFIVPDEINVTVFRILVGASCRMARFNQSQLTGDLFMTLME